MQPNNQPPLADLRIGSIIGPDNPAQVGDVVEKWSRRAPDLLIAPPRGREDGWWARRFFTGDDGTVHVAGGTVLATGQPLDLREWPPTLPAIARAKKGERFTRNGFDVFVAAAGAEINGARFVVALSTQGSIYNLRVTEQTADTWTPLPASPSANFDPATPEGRAALGITSPSAPASPIGGTADKVGVHARDKWLTKNGREFWPLLRDGGKLRGVMRTGGNVESTFLVDGLLDYWHLAAIDSTPPPLSGKPLPERPKARVGKRVDQFGYDIREGDVTRFGDWSGWSFYPGNGQCLMACAETGRVDDEYSSAAPIGREVLVHEGWSEAQFREAYGAIQPQAAPVVDDGAGEDGEDDPPLAFGNLAQRRSRWLDGVLFVNASYYPNADHWAPSLNTPRTSRRPFYHDNPATVNRLRALFGVEPLAKE